MMARPMMIQGTPPENLSHGSGSMYLKMSSAQQVVRHICLPDAIKNNPIDMPVAPIAIPTFIIRLVSLTPRLTGKNAEHFCPC